MALLSRFRQSERRLGRIEAFIIVPTEWRRAGSAWKGGRIGPSGAARPG